MIGVDGSLSVGFLSVALGPARDRNDERKRQSLDDMRN